MYTDVRTTGAAMLSIVALGTLALAGWIVLAAVIDPVGTPADVIGMIAIAVGEMALAAAAAWCVHRAGTGIKAPLGTAMALAALFRMVMIPAGLAPGSGPGGLIGDLRGETVAFDNHLLYDDDVWRYLWDGHVQRLGFDPYATSPSSIEARADDGDPVAEALLEEDLWFEIHQRIGYPAHPSVYPPLAQLGLRGLDAVAPGSVVALKLTLVAADLVVCWLLILLLRRLGRPPALAVLYAWHPLPIKEIAGSAHIDAWVVAFVVAAVLALIAGRGRSALLAWAAAVATKLSPAALVGVFGFRTPWRQWWIAGALLGLVAWPFAGSLGALFDSLRGFAGTWRFNAGLWRLTGVVADAFGATDPAWWADAVGRTIVVAVVVAATWNVARLSRSAVDDPRSARTIVVAVFAIFAALLLTAPAVMPWYALWALPFAVAAGRWPFVIFGVLLFFSYLTYTVQKELGWWLWIEHGGYAFLLACERFVAFRRRLMSARP